MTSPIDGKIAPFGQVVDKLRDYLHAPAGDLETDSGELPNLHKLNQQVLGLTAGAVDAAKETADSSGLPLTDYADARALNTDEAPAAIRITGVAGLSGPSPRAGVYRLKPDDTSTADNGGRVLVDQRGRRYWRELAVAGTIALGAFADLTGATDATAQVQAALNCGVERIEAKGGELLCGAVTVPPHVQLIGDQTVVMTSGGGTFVSSMGHRAKVRGFRINCGGLPAPIGAIVGNGADDVEVSYNIIEYSSQRSISLVNCGGSALGNSIRNATGVDKWHLYVSSQKPISIKGNNVVNVCGNAIYVDGGDHVISDQPHTITENYVDGVTKVFGDGQYGNGIHCWNARGVRIYNNTVWNTEYSTIRCASSPWAIVMGNAVRTPTIDTAIFVEFRHGWCVVNSNTVEAPNAAWGISIMNYGESDGKLSACNGNIVQAQKGIHAESYITLDANVLDCSVAGIVLGNGLYCRNITTGTNIITDSQAVPTLQVGVAIQIYSSAFPQNLRDVVIGTTIVDKAQRKFGGHNTGVFVDGNGNPYPVPEKYVMFVGNPGIGLRPESYHGWSAAYSYSRTRYLEVGRLPYSGALDPIHAALTSLRRLRVDVEGGRWEGDGASLTTYTIGCHGGWKRVFRNTMNGSWVGHDIKVYDTGTEYVVVLVTDGDVYWTLSVQAHYFGAKVSDREYSSLDEVTVRETNVSGWTDVTGQFERPAAFETDNFGNFGNMSTGAGWDGGFLRIGEYRMFSGTGGLRVKYGSNPTGPGDGGLINLT